LGGEEVFDQVNWLEFSGSFKFSAYRAFIVDIKLYFCLWNLNLTWRLLLLCRKSWVLLRSCFLILWLILRITLSNCLLLIILRHRNNRHRNNRFWSLIEQWFDHRRRFGKACLVRLLRGCLLGLIGEWGLVGGLLSWLLLLLNWLLLGLIILLGKCLGILLDDRWSILLDHFISPFRIEYS